jgi:hypothetical protein
MGLISDVKIDGNVVREAGEGVKKVFEGIGGFIQDIASAIRGKVSPEEEARLIQRGAELQALIDQGQVEINKIEAASANVFVAGWRPFIGWVCGISLGAYYIPQALIASFVWITQCFMILYNTTNVAAAVMPPYPNTFHAEEILGLVAALLGMGGLRSWEKTRNGK